MYIIIIIIVIIIIIIIIIITVVERWPLVEVWLYILFYSKERK